MCVSPHAQPKLNNVVDKRLTNVSVKSQLNIFKLCDSYRNGCNCWVCRKRTEVAVDRVKGTHCSCSQRKPSLHQQALFCLLEFAPTLVWTIPAGTCVNDFSACHDETS